MKVKAETHYRVARSLQFSDKATKRQVARHTAKVASNKVNKLNNTTVFHLVNFIAQSDFFFSLIGSVTNEKPIQFTQRNVDSRDKICLVEKCFNPIFSPAFDFIFSFL